MDAFYESLNVLIKGNRYPVTIKGTVKTGGWDFTLSMENTATHFEVEYEGKLWCGCADSFKPVILFTYD